MKILITGSSGMLGTELCKALEGNYRTLGMDLKGPRSEGYGPQRFFEGDIAMTGDPGKVFAESGADLVIHAAAWTDVDGCELDPDRAYNVNTTGTENVCAAARDVKASVMFISTDFIFNGKKRTPYVEDDKPGPLSVYGLSKLKAEQAVAGTMERYAVVRTSWLYGKNGKNFVDTILDKASREGAVKVVQDQIGSPTYAKDLAWALKALIDAGVWEGKGVYHACNTGECSWFDLAAAAIGYAGLSDSVRMGGLTTEELGRPALRPGYSAMDNSKLQKRTGMAMRQWKEALEDYVKNDRSF
ncbi:MAG: dTDP-4-dehydrorhamnose reductase [Candidatus Omnitrophica bacterium]|nr:dTDP-4-dehydrorhamnose reductase [Candidatus Omnitrophota bacterium]